MASAAEDAPDVDDSYVVVLEDSADEFATTSEAEEEIASNADKHGIEPRHVYAHAVAGYSAQLTPDQVADLEADSSVAYVEEDRLLELQQSPGEQTVPTGLRRAFAPDNPNLGIGGPDDLRVDADVAVIDTGVAAHPDLNVVDTVDCTGTSGCTPGGSDSVGHGTHVAGSTAAVNNDEGVVGVAPGARIWSQKVCPTSSCSMSAIIAGVDYVTAHADEIDVANMSLGGPGSSQALDDAIDASVGAGVVYVVAAGNDSVDAGGYTPANHPDVITVSALADADGLPGGAGGAPDCRPASQDDYLADFSNWGAVVNVAAPGTCITSTWPNGGYNTISGTSMASPHVAGAAALLASGDDAPVDRAGVLAVRDTIESTGNFDWSWVSKGTGDVHEPLLDVQDASTYDPTTYTFVEPVASFEVSCDDVTRTCDFDGSASHDPDGGAIEDWSWDFGDGETGSGATVSHTYQKERHYTATLTVTASEGRKATTTHEFVVGDPAWTPSGIPPAEAGGWSSPGVQCPNEPDAYYKSGWRYEYSTDTWTELPRLPDGSRQPSYAAVTCTEDGHIHVLGGSGGDTYHYVYDTTTQTWDEAAPTPRAGSFAAAGAWDGKVYVAGGAIGGLWDASDEVNVYDIATDTWEANAPSLPDSTFMSGYTQSGRYLYVVGGIHATQPGNPRYAVDTVLRFDMTTQTWSSGPTLTSERYSSGLVATDAALYVLGGMSWDEENEEAEGMDVVERLDLDSWTGGQWTQLDPLPDARPFTGSACGTVGDSTVISVVGGLDTSDHLQMTVPGESCGQDPAPAWSEGAPVPDPAIWSAGVQCPSDPDGYYDIAGYGSASVWRYDFAADSWAELASYPGGEREALTAACTDDGKIHVLGGPGGSGTDHFVYDITTDAWEEAAPAPRVATLAAAAAWDGKVYLVGGADGFSDETDEVNVYDIATDTWEENAAPAPSPVAVAGFVQSGSDLYVAGGRTGGSPDVTDTVWRFDLTSGTWSTGPSLSVPTYAGTLVATGSALYLMGGIGDGAYTDAVHRLDLSSWESGTWTAFSPLPSSRGFAFGACGTAGNDAIIAMFGGFSGGDNDNLQATRAGEACVL